MESSRVRTVCMISTLTRLLQNRAILELPVCKPRLKRSHESTVCQKLHSKVEEDKVAVSRRRKQSSKKHPSLLTRAVTFQKSHLIMPKIMMKAFVVRANPPSLYRLLRAWITALWKSLPAPEYTQTEKWTLISLPSASSRKPSVHKSPTSDKTEMKPNSLILWKIAELK